MKKILIVALLVSLFGCTPKYSHKEREVYKEDLIVIKRQCILKCVQNHPTKTQNIMIENNNEFPIRVVAIDKRTFNTGLFGDSKIYDAVEEIVIVEANTRIFFNVTWWKIDSFSIFNHETDKQIRYVSIARQPPEKAIKRG